MLLVRSKTPSKRDGTKLPDADWQEHLRRHPVDEINTRTGKPLSAPQRVKYLKQEQGIIVHRTTVGRHLNPRA